MHSLWRGPLRPEHWAQTISLPDPAVQSTQSEQTFFWHREQVRAPLGAAMFLPQL